MSSVIWKYVTDILMNVLKQILTIDSEEGDFWVLEFQYYVSTMLKAKRYWGGQGKLDAMYWWCFHRWVCPNEFIHYKTILPLKLNICQVEILM
jgi:hypothetical protein